MKNKSCVWLVCMLLCIAVKGNAQVITLENGFGITSMRAKKASTNKVYPYQMSLGYQYLDKGWYNLSSNIGYTRRGGQVKIPYNSITGAEWSGRITEKDKLHYLTLSTTFDIKKTSRDGYTFFIGVGPRLDFNLKSVVTTYSDFDDTVSDYKSTKEKLDGIHPVLFGLKCVGGIRKDFRNMQLGFNIAYLPSFTCLSDGIRDRTFTFGLSLGYKLGTEKTGTIRSVRRHK